MRPLDRTKHAFIISADLGQVNDWSAFTILERIKSPPEYARFGGEFLDRDMTVEYHLRHIERPDRGTSYPDVIHRIAEL